jgi:pre-mRNA-processing factor 39
LWERGATAVGTDFASHTFWDKYIEFETSQEAFPRVVALYLRILQTPLDQLAQYHNKFKTFVNSRPLSELLLPNEETELEAEKKKHEEKYNELTAKKEEGEAIDPSEIAAAGIKTGDEVEVEFRARVMANREELYKKVIPLLSSISIEIL